MSFGIEELYNKDKINIDVGSNSEYSYIIPAKFKNKHIIYRIFTYIKDSESYSIAGYPNSLLELSTEFGIISYNPIELEKDDTKLFLKYNNSEDDIRDNRYKLISLSKEIITFDLFGDNISNSELMRLNAYCALLFKSVPKNHVYYYKKYGNDFFEWVDNMNK